MIRIYKRPDDGSGCFGIVVGHGVGSSNPMNLFESLNNLTERKLKIGTAGQTAGLALF